MPKLAFDLRKYITNLESKVQVLTTDVMAKDIYIETLETCVTQQDETIQELRARSDVEAPGAVPAAAAPKDRGRKPNTTSS